MPMAVSGSTAFYFLDATTTGLPVCPDATDFYCPPTLRSFSATHRRVNGATSAITFNIGNADALPARFNAFSEVGGPNAGSFDWGLPFFFGRTVFTAIEGQSTPATRVRTGRTDFYIIPFRRTPC
ncbi:MAG: DUF3443 family protein [Acidobacteria bacterium]|nr:DUF3443 family protein [Acidobacteriota bacterium]